MCFEKLPPEPISPRAEDVAIPAVVAAAVPVAPPVAAQDPIDVATATPTAPAAALRRAGSVASVAVRNARISALLPPLAVAALAPPGRYPTPPPTAQKTTAESKRVGKAVQKMIARERLRLRACVRVYRCRACAGAFVCAALAQLELHYTQCAALRVEISSRCESVGGDGAAVHETARGAAARKRPRAAVAADATRCSAPLGRFPTLLRAVAEVAREENWRAVTTLVASQQAPTASRPSCIEGELILFTVTFRANAANDLTCSPSNIINIFFRRSCSAGVALDAADRVHGSKACVGGAPRSCGPGRGAARRRCDTKHVASARRFRARDQLS